MRLFIDIYTGEVRRTLTGLPLSLVVLNQGDKLPLEVQLVNGQVPVTASVLTGSKALGMALGGLTTARPVLAVGINQSIAGETLTLFLDLSATPASTNVASYFANVPDSQTMIAALLEFEIQNGSTSKETLCQISATIKRDINAGHTPTPPTAAQITDEAGNILTDEAGNPISFQL